MTVTELMVELQRLTQAGEGGRRVIVTVCEYGVISSGEDVTGVSLGDDYTAEIDW